jgi:hypothetical protein
VLGIGFCDILITRPQECYGVCTCLSVIEEPHIGSLGPLELSSRERERERERENVFSDKLGSSGIKISIPITKYGFDYLQLFFSG